MHLKNFYQIPLIFCILLSLLPIPAFAQEPIRLLERTSNGDAETEHVIILVSGWQVGGTCLFEQLDLVSEEKIFNALTGLDVDIELFDIVDKDPCDSDFVPWDSFRHMSTHLSNPDPDESEMVAGHDISFPNYPLSEELLLSNIIDTSASPNVIYYSYTGRYEWTKVRLDDKGKSQISRNGSCAPAEQLDISKVDQALQCHPSYTPGDTSVIIQRDEDSLNFAESLIVNFIKGLSDVENLRNFVTQYITNNVNYVLAILNPLDNPTVEETYRVAIESNYISYVASQASAQTSEEFGLHQIDLAIPSPQRLLFNQRARHMQTLINDVVQKYDDKRVEITLVGHSQGGLVAAYWAGWNGDDDLPKDDSSVNAIVTLDSPLGLKTSFEGLWNAFIRDQLTIGPFEIPIESVIVTGITLNPSTSAGFFNWKEELLGLVIDQFELFPNRTISVPEIKLGEYLGQIVGLQSFRLFYGIEDVVNASPKNTPLYTIRNEKDGFVVADYAYPANDVETISPIPVIAPLGVPLPADRWHDKIINYDWNDYRPSHRQRITDTFSLAINNPFDIVQPIGDGTVSFIDRYSPKPGPEGGILRHIQVKDDFRISKDIQFVATSGSIYEAKRRGQLATFTQGAINNSSRIELTISRPAYTAGSPILTGDDFQVELLPTIDATLECPSTSVQAAHLLNVVSVSNINNDTRIQDFSGNDFTQYRPDFQGPATILKTTVPTDLQAGCYDAVITYGEENDGLKATRSTLRRAVSVTNEPEREAADASIVVVVDSSGSMGDITETGNAKYVEVGNAAKFLVQLVFQDVGTRLGLMGFSDDPFRIYPAFGNVLSPVTDSNLNQFIGNIDDKLEPLFGTQLTKSLLSAAQWIEADNADPYSKAIVVLSDGDSQDSWAARQAEFAISYPDIPIYTIGYGQDTGAFNEPELRQIAQDTGAFYRYAPDANSLRQIYESIRQLVTGLNGFVQLEQSLLPTSTDQIRFNVDPALDDMKLVLSWDPQEVSNVTISFTTPDGNTINAQNAATELPGATILEADGSWIFSFTSPPQSGEWVLEVVGAQISSTGGQIDVSSSTQSAILLEDAQRVVGSRVGSSLYAHFSLSDFNPDWDVQFVSGATGIVTVPSGEEHRIDVFDDGFHNDNAADDFYYTAVVPASLVTEPGQYSFEVEVVGTLLAEENRVAAASALDDEQPFQRIFSMQRTVVDAVEDSALANLQVMVTEKPNLPGQYCITYANQGPGDATDVALFMGVDNGAVIGASVEGERYLKGFSYGWELGTISAGESGLIESLILPIDDALPMKVVGMISNGILTAPTATSTVDNIGSDSISTVSGTDEVQQLNAGWNLVGLAEHPTLGSPESLLCGVDASIDVILGYEREGLTYDPDFDSTFNTLESMNGLDSYWIRTEQAGQMKVNGLDVPVETPIELSQGWNMITYLPETPQAVADALSSIDGDYTTVLGYNQGAMSFYSDIPGELATLQTLDPGMGYLVYMTRATTLTYHNEPAPNVSAATVSAVNTPQRPGGVMLSNSWMNLYISSLTVHGQPAANGMGIEIVTETGLRVGEGQINSNGQALVTIYGDDSFTQHMDGAIGGDLLVVSVNGEEARATDGSIIEWKGMGALMEIHLVVGDAPTERPNVQFTDFIFMPVVTR